MPKIINNNYFIFPSFLPFILFLTTISALLFFPLLPVNGFEAIPFLQIDYNFYIRLAQCEAKCLEKFSSLNKRIIIAPTDSQSITDKQFNQQMAIGSSLMLENICKQGCLDSDSPPPPPPPPPPQSPSTFQHQHQLDTQPTNAFVLGQQFFKQSSNKNPPPPPFFSSSFGGIIRPLCVQKMSSSSIPSSQNTFSLHQEKFETFLIYEELNEKIKKENLRFVVCWRSRKVLIKEEGQREEEPQWITASIESSHRFKVSSLRPGLLYQFKVQAVSPIGIQVPAAFSDWIDFNSLIYGSGINTKSLQFYSQFNSDYGVAAWVSWRLNEVKKVENGENGIQTTKPILNARLRRHLIHQNEDFNNTNNLNIQNKTIKSEELFTEKQKSSFVVFPFCKLQIEWANKSSRASDKFELDGSDGYLLTNLAFNSEYWVNIRAEYNNSNNIKEEEEQLTTTLFEGNFVSMKCVQVYGFGSLECKPEPIQKLSIFPFPTNNTALVKWERPLAITNVLLYELNIEPIIRSGDDLNIKEKCKTENGLNTKIVSAQANFTWISLPHEAVCEFEVRHTLYDLLGREATSHLRFIFTPSSTSEPSSTDTQYSLAFRQFISQLDISVLALVCVIVLVPITALIALICTISRRDTRQKTKKRNKKPLSAEKHNKIIKKTKMQKNNVQRPTIVNDSRQNYYSNTNINSVIITSLEDTKYISTSNQQISSSNKLNTSPQSSSCVSAGAETTVTLLPLKGENGEINNNCGDIKLNNSFGNTAWTGQNRRVKIEMPLILN